MHEIQRYIPYMIIPALELILFILSHGTFSSAAAYLLTKIKGLNRLSDAEALSRALMILLLFDLAGAASVSLSRSSDTAAQGYLERQEYGGTDEEARLLVTLDGNQTQELTVDVAARQMSADEIQTALSDAAAQLESVAFGETVPERTGSTDSGAGSADGIIYEVHDDLTLPSQLDGFPVNITWYSGRPDVLDDDGTLQKDYFRNNTPDRLKERSSGTSVILTAELSCGDQSDEVSFQLRVFPPAETDEERSEDAILTAIEDASDSTSPSVLLPSEIDGKTVSFETVPDGNGILVLLFGIVIAVFYVYSRIRLRKIDTGARKDSLTRDYPDLVEKLVLLLTAGMSLRGAFARMASDYRKDLAAGGNIRPAFDEVCLTVRDMERGVTEAAAYEEFGRRCDLPLYRTFSTLLVENLKKGGPEMRMVMQREAIGALEERRKNARIAGEKAGTRLILPMILMLIVVMMVLVVPALLAFF